MFFEEHRHIRVTANAIATVSPDCSPETLALLADMANIVDKRVKKVISKMESRKILPVNERLKKGQYTKVFNSKNFKELQELCKKYHFALLEAEEDLFLKNIGCNSEKILPKSKRLPFENGNEYVGISKFVFYTFRDIINKYHNALENAEYNILNHSITNKFENGNEKK